MDDYCVICGKRATDIHHLIFGVGVRKLADEDKLYIPLCAECHTMGRMSLHGHSVAERLSKMLGQAIWERDRLKECNDLEKVRSDFIKRYGGSYL